MIRYFSILTSLFFCLSYASGQTTAPTAANASEPAIGYPITDVMESDAMKEFNAAFSGQNVGFFHVYADPEVGPEEVYLLRGEPANGTVKALLPKKYQRLAQRMNAKIYTAGAIRGINENMYIVRMDGLSSDRIELFAIRGNRVKHLKTLAERTCKRGKCRQTDSYITDINGDTNLDLVTIKRKVIGTTERSVKRRVYSLNKDNRNWEKTDQLDAPWDSIDFFDPQADDQ